MSRTPLFRLLRRSYRLARHSMVTSKPAGEVVDEWREVSRLSRRQLLGGTAAAAGLALAGCRPFAPPRTPAAAGQNDGGTVVIVGAGIAGLTAGYRLMQQGIRVRIFEAQERSGEAQRPVRRDQAHAALPQIRARLMRDLLSVIGEIAAREPP